MIEEDVKPSPAFEEWASEEGINNFHFYHCWAAWQAGLAQRAAEIPESVRIALERMCTPLDKSVLTGATADADAHSMKIIRDYVLCMTRNTEPAHAEIMEIARYYSDVDSAGRIRFDEDSLVNFVRAMFPQAEPNP